MHSLFLLASVLASSAAIAAQTPPGFPPSATAELGLAFGNITISLGEQIGINVPANRPTFTALTPLNPSLTFFLAIVDPDAPTPQNPNISQYLHYLQPGVTFPSPSSPSSSYAAAVASFASPAIVPYARPAPPPYSVAHRYIALLFGQPANFSIPADFQQYNATYRMFFDIGRFAADAGLGEPLAGNYFLVSNQTGNASATATGGTPIATFKGEGGVVRSWSVKVMIGVVGVCALLRL